MTGKRVLVTGSGTGIGKGIALEFANKGAAVAFHYSHSDKDAHAAVEQIRKNGGKAEAFGADFNNVQEAKDLVSKAVDFLGGLDVLVNNAGITMNMPFDKVTVEQYDTLYNVNIRGMFFATQAAASTMIKQGKGVVINLTSTHALTGVNEHSVYAGTKGAIVAFTRQLAVELGPKGIRVNAIAPGCVVVENYDKAIANPDPEQWGRCVPAGFVAEPADVAKLAVYLASDSSRYIVGQTIVIDGGSTACMAFNEDFRKPVDGQFGKGYVPGI